MTGIERVCPTCETPFVAGVLNRSKNQRTCSKVCAGALKVRLRDEEEQALRERGYRICVQCLQQKSLNEFYLVRKRYETRCKDCCKQYAKDRHKKLRDEGLAADPNFHRRTTLYDRYRLSLEEYEAMLEMQGGRCAICSEDSSRSSHNKLVVDHDHSCCSSYPTCSKCVRGLLCSTCNSFIGHLESRRTLPAALKYLAKYGVAVDVGSS